MALIVVSTNAGEFVGAIGVTNAQGPWTDSWQMTDEAEFAELVDKALALEGDTG